MADLSDVMNALVSAVGAALYPNGAAQPSAIMVNGNAVPARIYPGWPVPADLDRDLRAGKINVSVFAPAGMEQNTTRYPRKWQTATPGQHTVTTAIDETGTILTIGGAPSVPQNVAAIVNGLPFVYSVQASDTLATIAAALAALITAGGFSAIASGAAITIAVAKSLVGRVGGVATMLKEVSRQNRLFQISFWCPALAGASPSAARDAAVKLVDPILRETNFLTLADGSAGRLIYQRTFLDDAIQKAGCYRRDLFYTVEYGTTVTEQAPEAVVVGGTMQGASAPFANFTPTVPPPIPFEA